MKTNCYSLPPLQTISGLLDDLREHFSIREVYSETVQRTWLDSFDHRLIKAGLCLRIEQSAHSQLKLAEIGQYHPIANEICDEVPVFPEQMSPGKVKEIILPLLKVRALIPIGTQQVKIVRWQILNKQQKSIANFYWELEKGQDPIAFLIPVRGYQKASIKFHKCLQKKLGMRTLPVNVFSAFIQQNSIQPGTYSNRISSKLKKNMRSDDAVASILLELLDNMQINEQGILDEIDTEFLHDFRIATRKSRSILMQTRNIFVARDIKHAQRTLAWLAKVTSYKRDLDVYLHDFSAITNHLPRTEQNTLIPLKDYLIRLHKQAGKKLLRSLQTKRYQTFKQRWHENLNSLPGDSNMATQAATPIETTADSTIWRVYKKVIKSGASITDDSTIDELHELRKTCKKLRYLMEAYHRLYSNKAMANILLEMKKLQNGLGSITDLDVQQGLLYFWADEMTALNVQQQTLGSMAKIARLLQKKEIEKRDRFKQHFKQFSCARNQKSFKLLFKPSK